jgi:hypothetical protein
LALPRNQSISFVYREVELARRVEKRGRLP